MEDIKNKNNILTNENDAIKKINQERDEEIGDLRHKQLENERKLHEQQRELDDLKFKLAQGQKEAELIRSSSEKDLKQKIVTPFLLKHNFLGQNG